jgi:glycosyltransferase involved in cell wall biosynthesis
MARTLGSCVERRNASGGARPRASLCYPAVPAAHENHCRRSMAPKIVHVNTARGYRGGERQTELLIRGLATRGVRQGLIARRGADLANRVRDVAIDIREVNGGLLSVTGATRDAALLHVHEGRSVYAAYLRAVLSGTPYVITRRVNNPIRDHWFAHRAYARAAYVAAVAPQVAAIVRAYDPKIPVGVVHSGSSGLPVDHDAAARIRQSFAGKLIVGHVGALDNGQKGQEFIIVVARELALSHPDVHFMLVGGGDDEAMLKGLAAGLENITFTGFVDNVGDYLAAFDIFILPSNREGIGSILLDAMEQGLPVIASRVGGVPDIVHHEINGLLVEPANPPQLRDAILALRADPARRRAYGERGREFAKDYTGEAMWRKYFALYESLLGPLT